MHSNDIILDTVHLSNISNAEIKFFEDIISKPVFVVFLREIYFKPGPKSVSNRYCTVAGALLDPGLRSIPRKNITKNRFGGKIFKNPDFSALEILLRCTVSNIMSL